MAEPLIPVRWAEVRAALYDWLHAQTGLTVVWANEAAARPPYPYATINIPNVTPVHQDEQRIETEDGGNGVKVVSVGNRELTISCQAFVSFEAVPHDYEADAMHFMSMAQASLNLDEVLSRLKAAGVYVQEALEIIDLSGALEALWLSRAAFDIKAGLSFRVDPGTFEGSIAQVEVSSALEGQQAGSDIDLSDEVVGNT